MGAVSRRSFCKAVGAAIAGAAGLALGYDAVVNGGRPACAEEQPEGSGKDEPPH